MELVRYIYVYFTNGDKKVNSKAEKIIISALANSNIAMPPLYRIKWTNAEHEFAYSDKERDKLLTAGQSAGHRLPKEGGIQRYKGLGEMNDHELWETTMDPAHRILKQVTLDEAADADEIFTILMGDDVDRRRSFIQHNASDVRFLDI